MQLSSHQRMLSVPKFRLRHPQIESDVISRPRLMDKLNTGLNQNLILITAPAGFGKTTIASHWLETVDRPSVWLSLEESDNTLDSFLTYLIASLRSIFPNRFRKTASILQSIQTPPPDYIASLLLEDIEVCEKEFITVIDDYHIITNDIIHKLISHLIRQPLEMKMCLVVLSRTVPALSFSRLRLNRKMTHIRGEDLRFTLSETHSFLEKFMGKAVEEKIAALLESRTEGWIAGLRLAAFSMKELPDYLSFAKTFRGSNWQVSEYVLDEILEKQTIDVQDFLLDTSILSRFCSSLCEAVMGVNDPSSNIRSIINQLSQNNMFLVPLDTQHNWFRFHHLFQESLYTRLAAKRGEAKIAKLHKRACLWLADNGYPDDAMYHALAADDMDTVADLIEENRLHLFNSEAWRILEQQLASLPQHIIDSRPALLLTRACIFYLHDRYDEIPPLLHKAKSLLSREPVTEKNSEKIRSMWGEIDLYWCIIHYWQNESEKSMERALSGLEKLSPEWEFLCLQLTVFLSLAYLFTGRSEERVRYLTEEFNKERAESLLNLHGNSLSLLFLYLLSGRLIEADHMARFNLSLIENSQLYLTRAWAHYLLGFLRYEWNQVEEAIYHFNKAMDIRYHFQSRASISNAVGLILAYQAQGLPDKADDTMVLLEAFARNERHPSLIGLVHSFSARLSLHKGDLQEAISLCNSMDPSVLNEPLYYLEVPRLTKAKILITQGSTETLRETDEILNNLLKIAVDMHLVDGQIKTLAIQAVLKWKKNENKAALKILTRALDLGREGNYIRSFLDLGQPMVSMLYQLAKRKIYPEYVNRILSAFTYPLYPSETKTMVKAFETAEGFVEPLTKREIEIIELLDRRFANKEIAQRLFISPQTVQKHTFNIYQKLNAHDRRQACIRAKELGILVSRSNPQQQLLSGEYPKNT